MLSAPGDEAPWTRRLALLASDSAIEYWAARSLALALFNISSARDTESECKR
jgi:hypothetical protein